MSDTKHTKEKLKEAEYRKKLSLITTKVLDDFLRSRGVESSCPICSNTEMAVPQVQLINQEGEQDVLGRHVHYEAYVTSQKVFDPVNYCYHIICKNCGFIMNYNTAVVLNWFISKDDQDDQE